MEKRLTNIKKSSFGVKYYLTKTEIIEQACNDKRSLARDLFAECLFTLTGIDGRILDFWRSPYSDESIRIYYINCNGERYVEEFSINDLLESNEDAIIDYVIERR